MKTTAHSTTQRLLPQIRTLPPIPPQLIDFRVFLTLIWRHLGLGNPTPVQFSLANYLQHGPQRKILGAFRGIGKSWITSAYVVWRLRQNPCSTFLVVSAGHERAANFTQFTLKLLDSLPLLHGLKPRRGQRCSASSFDVGPARADHAPSVTSRGIFSQLTGSRADEIIADDIEIPTNALSQLVRSKVLEAVKEFDAIIKPGGRITYLGTPQTEDSLYNVLARRGYTTRLWPARFPTEEQAARYGSRLAPMLRRQIQDNPNLIGQSVEPTRFTNEDLRARELSYGRSGFQLQFMLDTRLSDADRHPLKLSDLMIMPLDTARAPEKPVWAADAPRVLSPGCDDAELEDDQLRAPKALLGEHLAYTGAVLAIDPAGRGQDETAACVVKMLNGYLYVTALFASHGGYDEATLAALADLACREQVHAAVIEANFGDGMFARLLSPHFTRRRPIEIIERRHAQQKEARIIDTLEPVLNQHRLVISTTVLDEDAKAPSTRRLLHQMRRITRDKGSLLHDDRLDCLAMAVAYWTDHMDTDADQRMDARRAELLRAEMGLWDAQVSVGGTLRLAVGAPTAHGETMRFAFASTTVRTG